MPAARPIAVTEGTAARMLELPRAEFKRLVGCGSLPKPVTIGENIRWRVSDLEAILNATILNEDEFET